jgi:hypothetical protein
MGDGMAVRFETHSGVDTIDRDLWNHLAEGASPMMQWDYFYALEKSGSASPLRGYRPCHLVAYSDNKPVALAPLYERDRAWVEFGDGGLLEFLTEMSGLPFNHGLVGTIPFTPVPGYQLLTRPGADTLKAGKMLLDYVDYLCQSRRLSTTRLYFISPVSSAFHKLMQDQGYYTLSTAHFLWMNRDCTTFEDYLASFKSSRRTKIRRELRTIQDKGIDLRMIAGRDAPDSYFEDMHRLYLRTWMKHMGTGIRPFLGDSFFKILGERFRDKVSFSVASREGKTLAMALFYETPDRLYGRHWGTFMEVPFLHFATCYYYPIDYAIRKRIPVVDPGFGGEHKLIRGYETVPVYHYIKFFGKEQQQIAAAVLRQYAEPFELG